MAIVAEMDRLTATASERERNWAGPPRLVLIWLILIISLLAWRTGTYYAGGIDPVVAIKAALGLLAFTLALGQVLRTRTLGVLGPRSLMLVTLYLLATALGGWSNGTAIASGVLAVRALLVIVTVAFVIVAYPRAQVIRSGVIVLAVVGTVCAMSGLGALASRGRLYGQLIPVNPNEIAAMLGPAAVWLVWRMLRSPTHLHHIGGLAVLIAMTWLTGSRTGLVALLVAVVIVLVGAQKLPVPGFIALLLAVPGVFYVVALTGVLSSYLGRGGDGNVMTLNSRTIAWNAVFTAPADFWQHWLGGGLAVKTVAVAGQYWADQVVDSSWVSAFAQGGVVGISLMGLWAASSLVAAACSPRPERSLLTALVVYALIQSVLENGLIDSTVLFVIMLLPALLADVRARGPGVRRASPGAPDRNLVG